MVLEPGAASYAADGYFTVSFFFSKAECKSFNTFQTLYLHRAPYTRGQPPGGSQAEIRVALGCSQHGMNPDHGTFLGRYLPVPAR